ncbi:AAA family ATPase [Arenimonas caeni]|nr:ATP-binding protein [Arenimonas caeni]
MRKKRARIEESVVEDPMAVGLPEVVRAWILRTLIKLGARRRVVDPDEMGAIVILEALGLDTLPGDSPAKPLALLSKLRAMAARYPDDISGMPLPSQLAINIDRVGDLLGLTRVERLLLAFAVLVQTEPVLGETLDLLGSLATSRIPRALAVILCVPEPEVREALAARGTLCRTGLLTVDRENTTYLQHKVDVLSGGFAERMTTLDADPVDLLRDKVFPSQAPTLGRPDFPHVDELAGLARDHLANALETRRLGTNLLVHGVPGVGKTEFARMLAAELGVELFEISSEDEDGDPIDGDRRLRAYRAAQGFFANRRLLFLFDEAEDVFLGDGGFFMSRSSAQRRKAWMNRMLESNPTPTIWVTNRVDCLDPAFVRRFDVVVELPNPPQSRREEIIRRTIEEPIEDSLVGRLAGSQQLTPAIVHRAASVVAACNSETSTTERSRAMELLVDATLRAQGHAGLTNGSTPELPEHYDTRYINADEDLGALSGQLGPNSSARILLHGPPGTGKTAYAHWLARKLAAPIIVRRASDLLSMYVGQTEQNIAESFAQAARESAVLLIDEVDGFLNDRRQSRFSWETTLVNEMLTQMESFPGIFIASTNLDGALDPASWRRFDLKVGFQHLRPEQAWALFQRACESAGFATAEPELESLVRGLSRLSAGDLHAVLRRNRIAPLRDARALYAQLLKEQSYKGPCERKMGFI